MSKEHSFKLDDKVVSHYNGETYIIAELLKNSRGLFYRICNYSTRQESIISEDGLRMDYFCIGKCYDPIKIVQ